MNSDLAKLLIGIGSAVLGIILSTFKEEIKNLFISSKKFQYLKGTWQCSWKEAASSKYPQGKSIFDNVQINTISGKTLKGGGHTEGYGPWKFTGKISAESITLMYKNEKGGDKSGVIILKLDTDDDNLEGAWCQFRNGEIANGTTNWKKLK